MLFTSLTGTSVDPARAYLDQPVCLANRYELIGLRGVVKEASDRLLCDATIAKATGNSISGASDVAELVRFPTRSRSNKVTGKILRTDAGAHLALQRVATLTSIARPNSAKLTSDARLFR